MRKALVYFKNILCGSLIELEDGYYFTYLEEYINNKDNYPISLLLPLRKEKYYSPNLFAFFDNLIPEGWLLDLYSTKYNIKKSDRFSLLLKLSDEPIGAVSVKETKDEK